MGNDKLFVMLTKLFIITKYEAYKINMNLQFSSHKPFALITSDSLMGFIL